MALINNLPPQAYTRDVLVKAIEWLSTQSPAVRERASSADLVVSYYLQAKRKIAAQMEAPVSGEAFMSDLKHLARDLKQFEEPSAPSHPPNRPPSNGFNDSEPTPVTPLYPQHQIHSQQQNHHQPPQVHVQINAPQSQVQHGGGTTDAHGPSYHYVPPNQQQAPPPPPVQQHHYAPAPPPAAQAPAPKQQWTIDSRSMVAIREIQQRFNLSCEGEAVRMLLTLGIERAKKMFAE